MNIVEISALLSVQKESEKKILMGVKGEFEAIERRLLAVKALWGG